MTIKVWTAERLYKDDLNANFAAVVAPLGCRVTRTAVQSITTATDTVIAFDAEVTDDGGFHSNVTNNSRLTVPTGGGGWYDWSWSIEWPANATGFRIVKVRRNAGNYIEAKSQPTNTAGVATQMSGGGSMKLAVGDYLELYVHQTSGGALNVNLSGDYTPIFTMAPRRGY